MAGATQSGHETGPASSDVRLTRLAHNRLVDDVGTLLAATAGAVLTGSATYDPASLADGVGATTTVTVTGAALGDYVTVSFSLDLQGILLTGYVSAANTVAVRFQNETGGTIDLASGTLRARVQSQAASVPVAAATLTGNKVSNQDGDTT